TNRIADEHAVADKYAIANQHAIADQNAERQEGCAFTKRETITVRDVLAPGDATREFCGIANQNANRIADNHAIAEQNSITQQHALGVNLLILANERKALCAGLTNDGAF